MHKVLTALTLVAIACRPTSAGRASPNAPAIGAGAFGEAVRTAVLHHEEWLGDSTPFDVCGIYRQTGSSGAFLEAMRPLLSRGRIRSVDGDPCAPTRNDPARRYALRLVSVDSASAATAERVALYATVVNGELQHQEVVVLDVHPQSREWRVAEVRLSRWGREYLRPPPGGWKP